MILFEFNDYRAFLQDFIKSQKRGGHGYKLKFAETLRVHPTLITQILKGQKSLSLEHALTLSQFIGFSELEKEYFLTLVEMERAGTEALRIFFENRLQKLKGENDKIKNRVQNYTALSEADQAIFYSHWYYSAIRLSCDLSNKVTAASLSRDLALPLNLVQQVLEFLISRGLVQQGPKGTLQTGVQNTFLPSDSPLISRHHMNWRIQALERHPRLTADELAFSAPVTVASADIPVIRKMCLSFIQKISKVVAASPPEKLACFTMDWFKIEPHTMESKTD
jgi:uncharacterized protein (TIGR02147 family)